MCSVHRCPRDFNMNVPAWVFGDDAFAQYLSRLFWGKIKAFILNAVFYLQWGQNVAQILIPFTEKLDPSVSLKPALLYIRIQVETQADI